MTKKQARTIILASTSPRRKELMSKTKLSFTAVDSGYEEDMSLPLPPRKLVKHLALGKASAVAKNYRDAIIIAADTFVIVGKKILGKPKSEADARRMLAHLSGKKCAVITGLALIDSRTNKKIIRTTEVDVFFRKITPSEAARYVATGEPMDKAGAFAVQGLGGLFIKKIIGDYAGIVGLPLYTLNLELRKFGIHIL